MLRVCTSSMVVQLSTGDVSLLLTDVRFRSFPQNHILSAHVYCILLSVITYYIYVLFKYQYLKVYYVCECKITSLYIILDRNRLNDNHILDMAIYCLSLFMYFYH